MKRLHVRKTFHLTGWMLAGALLVGCIATKAQAAKSDSFPYPQIDRVGWVEPDDVQSDGRIVGASVGNSILGPGMLTYCEFDRPPQLEDQYLIIRQSDKELPHPLTGSKSGYRIDIVGRLTIKAEEKGKFKGAITHGYDAIYRGDLLIPFNKGKKNIEITKSYSNTLGSVLALDRGLTQAGESIIVFLDKGSDQGVSVGNKFEIYRPAEELDLGALEDELPDVIYGKLLVLRVMNQTSTALIINSSLKIRAGARFRSMIE